MRAISYFIRTLNMLINASVWQVYLCCWLPSANDCMARF